jgi:hypothetical protein
MLGLMAAAGMSAQAPKAAPADLFADKPYALDLKQLGALDPKPLQMGAFAPDADPKSQGIRILSKGRSFPYGYEIIDIRNAVNPKILDAVSKSLDGHADIILKERRQDADLGDCLHYFQRVDVGGKPHHVSSNYIFVRGQVFYHVSASNFAAVVMKRESWGDPKPDLNAEGEVKLLLKCLTYK